MESVITRPPDLQRAASRASLAAAGYFAGNLRELRATQPGLAAEISGLEPGMQWVFGRDGALTGLEEDGRWWADCSLPFRAAEFMLEKAEFCGSVICFLSPVHAAQIQVALHRMTGAQALLALVPDARVLRIALACADFSADIAAHRLYFASGPRWPGELEQLLTKNSGLPTPTQFIRPILADPASADALIAPAQKIFAEQSLARNSRLGGIIDGWKPAGQRRICLVAPSYFRLWNDAGGALQSTVQEGQCRPHFLKFDPDDPASASPLALAIAASACDAIVTPNTARADLPGLVPLAMPWTTWITTARIPPPVAEAKRDTLIVAEPHWKMMAAEKGWTEHQIFVGGWPPARFAKASVSSGVFSIPATPCLVIISDTHPLDPPARVQEYSSHRLLWEAIRSELLNDPFAMPGTRETYLDAKVRQQQLDETSLDRPLFLDGLILHAYQQGIARLLLRAGLATKLFGSGWEDIEAMRPMAAGRIRSREQLAEAVESAAAIVHVWPGVASHPVNVAGKPVVCRQGGKDAFLRDAKLAIGRRLVSATCAIAPLTADLILRALEL